MTKRLDADLHIHTCLSPCAEFGMTPKRIVEKARVKGLDIIGICDHNSTENVEFAKKAGEREGIATIGGVEVTSQEEVHVLGLFDEDEALLKFGKIIHENLPGKNDEKVFGEQLIVDENDWVLGRSERLLIGATSLPLQRIVEKIHSFGGIAIASHIDRESFGIIGQLGLIPEGLDIDGVEISSRMSLEEARLKIPQASDFTMITSSDAHRLDDIGKSVTRFLIEEASVEEIGKALLGQDGRGVVA